MSLLYDLQADRRSTIEALSFLRRLYGTEPPVSIPLSREHAAQFKNSILMNILDKYFLP